MIDDALIAFPRSLTAYPSTAGRALFDILRGRIEAEPFNAFATRELLALRPAAGIPDIEVPAEEAAADQRLLPAVLPTLIAAAFFRMI